MADQSKPVQIGNGIQNAQPVFIVGGGGAGGESAGIGDPTDPAWNGADASASLISIMKAIYTQNATIMMEVNEIDTDMDTVKGLLQDIKTNTTPTP